MLVDEEGTRGTPTKELVTYAWMAPSSFQVGR